MDTVKARALTYEALVQLHAALDTAETPADFLAQASTIVERRGSTLELPVDSGAPDPLDPGASGAQGRDVDNAPRVYDFLGAIDPANAADRRLWAYLAFDTYRQYMEARWPLEGEGWKNRAETRWLMPRVNRGKLVRHGVARLWWIASLTYDPRLKHPLAQASGDPYAYTRAVLSNEDRVLALFDREAGGVPALVRRVLEHVEQDPARSSDKYVRALMKDVTLIYGYRDLAALDDDHLRAVVAEAAPS